VVGSATGSSRKRANAEAARAAVAYLFTEHITFIDDGGEPTIEVLPETAPPTDPLQAVGSARSLIPIADDRFSAFTGVHGHAPASWLGKLPMLEGVLGHHFADPGLLLEACTHPSYSSMTTTFDYERLEYLGDAAIQLAVSRHLVSAHRDWTPGALTSVRVALVSNAMFTRLARELGIDQCVIYGPRCPQTARGSSAILADVFEALVGALDTDGGSRAVNGFLARVLFTLPEATRPERDAVTSIREVFAKLKLPRPEVTTTGPDRYNLYHARIHSPPFTFEAEAEDPTAARCAAATRGLTVLSDESIRSTHSIRKPDTKANRLPTPLQ